MLEPGSLNSVCPTGGRCPRCIDSMGCSTPVRVWSCFQLGLLLLFQPHHQQGMARFQWPGPKTHNTNQEDGSCSHGFGDETKHEKFATAFSLWMTHICIQVLLCWIDKFGNNGNTVLGAQPVQERSYAWRANFRAVGQCLVFN